MSSRNVRLPTLGENRFGPQQLLALAEFVGFWLAVALPLVYLPLLVGGLSGWQLPTFIMLFAVNVFALFVGHDYGRDAA